MQHLALLKFSANCAVSIYYKQQIDYFANPIGGSQKQQQVHQSIIPKICHSSPEQSGFRLSVNSVYGKPNHPPKTRMKNLLTPPFTNTGS
jgi:hypothetical protein